MDMENSLLLGNGLNRCLRSSISWGELLKETADRLGVRYYPEISMPLEFERIVNSYLSKNHRMAKGNVYDEIKGEIAKKVCNVKLPEDAIHRQLQRLTIQNIMTTNYDFLLEKVYNADFIELPAIRRNKYLFEQTSAQKGIPFFHLHGIASNAQSLCLGYEHYMGIVEHLRNSLNRSEMPTEKKVGGMVIKQILKGEKEPLNKWGEKFYTSNVGIIGLELGENESDLWWLISHRAYLYYSDYMGLRTQLRNRIVYYDIMDEMKKADNQAEQARRARLHQKHTQHKLLRDSHIIVHSYVLGKEYQSYEEAYEAIISDIYNKGIE